MNAVSQSLTSASPSQTAGAILAASRHAKNIDLVQVSSYLRLAHWQVEALENDQYDRLAGPTFIRGIIRSYAKALGIDPQPALDAYGRIVPDAQQIAINVPSQNIRFDPTSLNGWGVSNKVGLIFLAVVVIAASFAVWYMPPTSKSVASVANKAAPELQSKSIKESALPANPTVPPAPAIPQPAAATITNNTSSTATMVERVDSAAEKSAVVTATAGGMASALPINQHPVQSATAATSVPSTAVSTATKVSPAIKSETVSPAVVVSPSVHPSSAVTAPAIAPAAVSGKTLRLSFQGKSWVEVKDGNKKIIFRELNSPGTERVLNGKPPFALVIGNAVSVRLFYNDKPIDLAPFTEVHVARLILE